MSFNELQAIFDTHNRIKFKLYSLESIDYSTRKNQYNSFKEAMNNFKVYNEPLISQLDRITIIEQGEDNGII